MSTTANPPTAPNMRSFSLNSDEAYEALCPREDKPWIMNGSLPREPRVQNLPVVVERDSSFVPLDRNKNLTSHHLMRINASGDENGECDPTRRKAPHRAI